MTPIVRGATLVVTAVRGDSTSSAMMKPSSEATGNAGFVKAGPPAL